jgi:hypothetical protein
MELDQRLGIGLGDGAVWIVVLIGEELHSFENQPEP